MTVTTVPILAAGHCSAECRPLAVVCDGQFVGLEGEDGLPPCPACLAAARRALGPDRLNAPLRVRGVERRAAGRADMEPAGWDEALEPLAALLAEATRGQRRIAWFSGGARPRLTQALARRVGSAGPETILVRRQPARETAARLLAGLLFTDERAPRLAPADLVLAWGIDPERGPLSLRFELDAVRASGARLVVIDPRASATARGADLHLPLRPGTDAALALGLAERVRGAGPRPVAIPSLLAASLAAWPIARSAEICGVPPAHLEQAAALLVAAKAPRLLVGGGPARHAEALPSLHAIAMLGRLARAPLVAPEPAPDPSWALPLPSGGPGARDVASGDLDAELRGRDPRRDIVVIEGGDPLVELPGGGELGRYLRQAGFVVVLADAWTPVCGQADLVLPVASILERADAQGLRWPAGVRAGRAALPVRRDALAEPALWHRIARRVGWPEAWFPPDLTDIARAVAAKGAPTFRPVGLPGRWEPPTYREAGEGPRSAPEVFRAFRLFATWGVPPAPVVAAEPATVTVTLSAADAAARHIADGDRVLVHNDRGKVPAVARVDGAEPQGVVTLPDGWPGEMLPAPVELLPEQRGATGVGGETSGPCLVEVGRLEA